MGECGFFWIVAAYCLFTLTFGILIKMFEKPKEDQR